MTAEASKKKHTKKYELMVNYLSIYADGKPINLSILEIDLVPLRRVIKRMIEHEVLVLESEEDRTFIVNSANFDSYIEFENKRRFVIIVGITIPLILFTLLGIAWILIIT